jgi:hypothetical protein
VRKGKVEDIVQHLVFPNQYAVRIQALANELHPLCKRFLEVLLIRRREEQGRKTVYDIEQLALLINIAHHALMFPYIPAIPGYQHFILFFHAD